MSVLPIVVIEVNQFAAVVHEISANLASYTQQDRLNKAFTKLIHFDVISAGNATGYEHRKNPIKFKYAFKVFVNDVHSFLVTRLYQ